jgi:peptide/nickel transport system permease protein
MTRFRLRRLLINPPVLALVHFLGFAYAHFARPIRAARTPYLRELIETTPLWDSYRQHILDIFNGNLGSMPGGQAGLGEMLLRSTQASLGLLAIALLISVVLGFLLGTQAVRTQPPGVRRWLTPLATLGLATPSFYLGSLGILAMVYYVLWRGPGSAAPLPIKGFAWDRHLVMPVIALSLRPTVQIAQVIAGLLAGELGKQYVVAARSFGHTWRNIRGRQAMRNVLAPILLTVAASLRQAVGELVVVEWLFGWSGLGLLLASTLVPGHLSTDLGATQLFLSPPVVAAIVTVIGLLFLVVDLISSVAIRMIDPRLRPQDGR